MTNLILDPPLEYNLQRVGAQNPKKAHAHPIASEIKVQLDKLPAPSIAHEKVLACRNTASPRDYTL